MSYSMNCQPQSDGITWKLQMILLIAAYTIFLEGVCRTSLYESELVWVFIYTHLPEFYFIGKYLHCSPLTFLMLANIFCHPVVFPFQCHNFVCTLSPSSHTRLLLHAKITSSINQFQLQLKFIIYLKLYQWGVSIIFAIQLKHAWKVKTSSSFQSNKKNHCICPPAIHHTKQNQPRNLCIISVFVFVLIWH